MSVHYVLDFNPEKGLIIVAKNIESDDIKLNNPSSTDYMSKSPTNMKNALLR